MYSTWHTTKALRNLTEKLNRHIENGNNVDNENERNKESKKERMKKKTAHKHVFMYGKSKQSMDTKEMLKKAAGNTVNAEWAKKVGEK